jgi:hypothetical protein
MAFILIKWMEANTCIAGQNFPLYKIEVYCHVHKLAGPFTEPY